MSAAFSSPLAAMTKVSLQMTRQLIDQASKPHGEFRRYWSDIFELFAQQLRPLLFSTSSLSKRSASINFSTQSHQLTISAWHAYHRVCASVGTVCVVWRHVSSLQTNMIIGSEPASSMALGTYRCERAIHDTRFSFNGQLSQSGWQYHLGKYEYSAILESRFLHTSFGRLTSVVFTYSFDISSYIEVLSLQCEYQIGGGRITIISVHYWKRRRYTNVHISPYI